MHRGSPARPGDGRLHRLSSRLLLAVAAAVVAAGAGTGLALARTGATPLGTGVVVIETALAYQNGAAAGTGMVLTSSGEILTNNHVIKGATTIRIVLPGTGRRYTAHVVGYDTTDDIAILQATNAANLATVSLGSSAKLKVGQPVTATGNAGGRGAITSSSGTITALRRNITVSDDEGGTESLKAMIQTNAAIEPGDSGGPLFDADGKVIGMDTAGSVTGGPFRQMASTDAFSIPIDRIVVIEQQIEAGTSSAKVHIGETAFMGVNVTANTYGGSGALIQAVVDGGPAAKAGLAAGDAITALDGHAIATPEALGTILLGEQVGAQLSLTYTGSDGASHTTTITLASGPAK